MMLNDYLERLGMSPGGFAGRAGVARGTVMHLLAGGGCGATAARKIIAATLGVVTLEDLAGPEPVEALEDAAEQGEE